MKHHSQAHIKKTLQTGKTCPSLHKKFNEPHFQRLKSQLESQILNFYHQKHELSNRYPKTIQLPNIMTMLLPKQSLTKPQKKEGLSEQGCQYLNEYIQGQKNPKKVILRYSSNKENKNTYQIIDNFTKQYVLEQKKQQCSQQIYDNKSFNQSTMTVTKQASPQRRIRKTQTNHKQKSKSISKIDISPNEYQSCPMSVSENQFSNKNTSREETKKEQVLLTQAKKQQRFKDSLQRIQQYDQLLDCNFDQQSINLEEENELMSYLKNKITSTKNKKHSKEIKQLTNGNNSVNIVGISLQNPNQPATIIEKKQLQQQMKKYQEDQNISTIFFKNHNSRPSTVQKINDKSNEKSEIFLTHLQELKDTSLGVELFNKHTLEKDYLPSQLRFSQQQKNNCNFNKKIEINLQDICNGKEDSFNFNVISSSKFDQSSFHPTVQSFRVNKIDIKQPKKIEIQLFPSQENTMQKDNTKEQMSLSDLQNYQSDDQRQQQKQRQLIEDLKQHVSNLKQKISSNLKSHSRLLNTSQVKGQSFFSGNLSKELQQGVSNLKKKMLMDRGLQGNQ